MTPTLYPFNVRVYGLLINEQKELLISDEEEYGMRFSKFPGGGLEYGEGLKEALIREYQEECNVDIEVLEHVFTTDFYEKSQFNESQIISIYYRVINISPFQLSFKQHPFDFDLSSGEARQAFRWVKLADLTSADLTFRTDQIALEYFLSAYK